MMKILANDGLAAEGVALLENSGFHVSTDNIPQEQLIEAINYLDKDLNQVTDVRE